MIRRFLHPYVEYDCGPPPKRFSVRFQTLLWSSLTLVALLVAGRPALAIEEDEFLLPEQAFKYTLSADPGKVTVRWEAAPGYYLYKKRMGLAAATTGVTVGDATFPKGEVHKDEYFGEQEVFRGSFT